MKLTVEKIIEDLIILRTKKGYSTGSLVKHIKKKYKLSDTRAFELIKLSRQKVGEFYYNTNESVLEDALERLELMFEKSIKNGDDKLALCIIQELNKIKQLHIQKMDITIRSEQPLFGDEENGDDLDAES